MTIIIIINGITIRLSNYLRLEALDDVTTVPAFALAIVDDDDDDGGGKVGTTEVDEDEDE